MVESGDGRLGRVALLPLGSSAAWDVLGIMPKEYERRSLEADADGQCPPCAHRYVKQARSASPENTNDA